MFSLIMEIKDKIVLKTKKKKKNSEKTLQHLSASRFPLSIDLSKYPHIHT